MYLLIISTVMNTCGMSTRKQTQYIRDGPRLSVLVPTTNYHTECLGSSWELWQKWFCRGGLVGVPVIHRRLALQKNWMVWMVGVPHPSCVSKSYTQGSWYYRGLYRALRWVFANVLGTSYVQCVADDLSYTPRAWLDYHHELTGDKERELLLTDTARYQVQLCNTR